MNANFKLENQLCFALYETSSLLTKKYTQTLQPFGLTYPQYLVLLALWEKDHQAVKELGEALGMGTGTLTPILQRMEKNEWLKKERSQSDERKVYVHLQPKATRLQNDITSKIVEQVLSCNFNNDQYIELLSNLKALKQLLEK